VPGVAVNILFMITLTLTRSHHPRKGDRHHGAVDGNAHAAIELMLGKRCRSPRGLVDLVLITRARC